MFNPHFHKNLQINLSIFTKKPTGILVEISWTIWLILWRTFILQVSLKEHRVLKLFFQWYFIDFSVDLVYPWLNLFLSVLFYFILFLVLL